jgi:mannose-6-phosphate isomerase-like protein (cupin superfamily)
MTSTQTSSIRVTRWHGGQHPTLKLLTQNLISEGKRAFKWSNKANYRFGVRSHGYSKTLYVAEGSIEVYFPDTRQRVQLRPGDRLDIARGVRHGITVGMYGVTALEGTPEAARRR